MPNLRIYRPDIFVKSMFYKSLGLYNPRRTFHTNHYLRHNARRLEHLSSLNIPVAGLSVLEVGAGIGDHSHYYIDRGCNITITDARQANISYLKKLYPNQSIRTLDLDQSEITDEIDSFDLVHCYGLLYHLNNPAQALTFLAKHTKKMLLLETCVSFGESEEINRISEDQLDPTQAHSGIGCRPTRPYIFRCLQSLFEHVYVPATQPNHEEFPLDWTQPSNHGTGLVRAVFIGSRIELNSSQLLTHLPTKQTRHP